MIKYTLFQMYKELLIMRKILFNLIIIIALLGNINIAEAQYAHPATAIKSANGNVQNDLNTLQANIASNTQEVALITSEIEAINQNLATHEAELASITAEINLMSVNLGTIEIRLDSIETNILSMIEPAITELRLNLSTIEDLINSNYNSLFANLQTHEIELAAITNEINLLNINLGTVEDRLNGFTLNFNTIEIELSSISVAINNLDLQLGIIELALSGGISGEVFTRTSNGFTWATPASGVTDHLLLSNIGTKTHLELEQDILDLQANPAGVSRVYIDGVALATGEVEFIAGANISLNVIGNTVEIESSGGGQTAEVNFVEKLNYSTREQGTAESGLFSIYYFNLPVSGTVLNSISCYLNGLKQDKGAGLDYIVDVWDDGGTSKYKIVFNKDLGSVDLVAISYFINATSVTEIVAANVSTSKLGVTNVEDALDTIEINYYNKDEVDDTIANAIAAIPAGGGTAVEDEGTYISDNKIWEFDTEYDTSAVVIYRNRIYQPRKLFATSVVSSKTRVTFSSAINASDEIILISNK
jgi:archaellum component FlaC